MKNDFRHELDTKFVAYHNTGFDIPNTNNCLKYVLVGITPGNNQQQNKEENLDVPFGSIEYKFKKAFCGKQMRTNLKSMFEHINKNVHPGYLNDLINFYKTDINKLFEFTKHSIIDFTSLLKNATYKIKVKEEKMFNTPRDINEKNKQLYELEFLTGFKKDYDDIYSKRDIKFIACGRQVYNFLIRNLKIDPSKVIAIVHPSGAAQGYINSFLNGNYNPEKLY